MPYWAPIISALTTNSSATEAVMRNPAKIDGSAPGQITRRTMSWNGTLKLCAIRIRLRGTASTPL